MNKDVRKALLDAKELTLDALQEKDPALAREVIALLQSAANEAPSGGRTPVDAFGPGDVVGTHPVLALQIARAQVEDVCAIAGLRGRAASAIADAAPDLSKLDEAVLARLVAEKKLTPAQVAEVLLCAALYGLVDDDAVLAKAIRTATLPRLGRKLLSSTRDLASLGAADWTAFFRSVKGTLPGGATPESAGASLAGRLAALHPGAALVSRFPAVSDAVADADLPPPRPRSGTMGPNAAPDPSALRTLSSAYPGLDLASVLDDESLDPKAKIKVITRRIQIAQRAGERLGDAHVRDLDLRSGSPDLPRLGLDELGATADEKRMVTSLFRSLQRMWALAKDVEDTHALLRKGFTSALSIGKGPLASFERAAGLEPKRARRIWENARSALTDVTLAIGAIVDVKSGLFDKIKVSNLAPSAREHLKELPGVAELFGGLSFCECEECQSILGPAAYFVDLMKFIDEHLRGQLQEHPHHPLDLKTRRPDLWTLDLGCKNIQERVPTLDIVNEILEGYLARKAGFQGSLADRAATSGFVYGETLSQAAGSFQQPFHLQLARIRSYLRGLGHTPAEVARALGLPVAGRAKAELGLSDREIEVLTSPPLPLERLRGLYDIVFAGDPAALAPVDAQVLGAATGLSRGALGQLVATSFVAAGGAKVRIQAGKLGAGSVQNDVERVLGLTADCLDRMHRLALLARKTGWSIPDLDAALTTLGHAELSNGAVLDLAALHALASRLGISVPEACALVEPIPGSPDAASLTLQRHARLAKLLGASAEDLGQLAGLRGADAVKGLPELSELLDLHAWWRQSGYSLDDVAVSVGRPPRVAAKVPDAAKVAREIVAGARASLEFTQSVFAVALGTTEQGSADIVASNPQVIESPAAGTWRLKAGALLDGATITIPPTAVVPVAPSGTRPVTPEEVRAALRPYVAAELLVRSLGAALGFGTAKVVALFALAGQALTTEGVVQAVRGDGPIEPLVAAVSALGPLSAALSAPVWDAAAIDFLRERPEVFGAEGLPHEAAEPGGAGALVVSLSQLQALSVYRRIVEQSTGKSPEASAATPEDIRAILTAFDPATCQFPPAADAAIARALGVPAGSISGLRGQVVLPETAAGALERLRGAALLAVDLGVEGDSLGAVVSESYGTLASAAEALLSALRARHGDEVSRSAKLDEVEQPVREARRDALADHLLHSMKPKAWSTLDDLVRYFLIDVNAGGCGTTSRVVAATMSAQMFVHRALLGFEEGDLPNAAEHVALRMPADAAAEWEWRRSYRVWQANRKVFLWPENYLEPALRGDKTPLFAALEQELLQTDIDDQSVLDAYSKYLSGLQELSSLTIAGAYHDVLSKEAGGGEGQVADVLHLFGATAADPPVYYYRTCENLSASARDPGVTARFSPWQRISVQIGGRKVSPVVHRGRLHVFWLDVRTRSVNQVQGGASQLSGYQHSFSLKFTTLQADGTWSVPQEVRLPGAPDSTAFGPARGQVMDPLWAGVAKLDPRARYQSEAVDDYTLGGPNWCGVWLQPSADGLSIQLRNFIEKDGHVDLFGRRIVPRPPATTLWHHPKLLCAKNTPAGKAVAEAVADARSVAVESADRIEKARAAAALAAKVDLSADFDAANNALLGNKGAKAVADANKVIANDVAILNNATLLAKDAEQAEAASLAAATAAAKAVAYAASSSGRKQQKALHTGAFGWFWSAPALANAVLDEERLDLVDFERPKAKWWLQTLGTYNEQIATLPSNTELLAIPGSEEDGLLQIDNDVLLLQGSVLEGPDYLLRRLGTTLVEETARRLFEDGLDGLLDTQTQLALGEAGIPISLVGDRVVDRSNGGELDFQGPYGVYYRELFFHIPLLLAKALNSRGRFEAARRWYHYIFDPTAVEEIDVTGVPASDVAHRLLDRVWRYRELRGLGGESLRHLLTDPDALTVYRRDPFNPWAIAGRRMSALQKAVVMGYIDNLLDWADSLFAQLTMESVNEAMMLYVTASDILGPRPARIEDCGAGVEPATYEKIGPAVDGTSEVLVELESVLLGARAAGSPSRAVMDKGGRRGIQRRTVKQAIARTLSRWGGPVIAQPEAPSGQAAEAGERGLFRGLDFNEARTASWGPSLGSATIKSRDKVGGRTFGPPKRRGAFHGGDRLGWSIARQIVRSGGDRLVFCVPSNPELLGSWDRVEDRLYKIRHCMDIDGQRREIALFAPPIDPRQLVAMKAAGLSLDDVLGAGNGDLPPYRFLYLVDRAKGYAASLGGFGAALLAALEKKDIEQLNRLRSTQQMNLAHLATQTRQLEIQAAEESLGALLRQREAASYRREYFESLLLQDRNPSEIVETAGRYAASGLRSGEAMLGLVTGVLGLVPQVGSPFAFKFGGNDLTNSNNGYAMAASAFATMADSLATSAGLQANFARRSDGWKHQRTLADHDLRSLDRQIKAARIRLDIANRGWAAHEKSLDQMQEMLDATDGKLTNLGLYTWVSAQLQGAYRSAYRNAVGVAKLAEQAFRFERGGDASPGLALSYWEPARAGLLAGERLLVDLQTLERRYLETNYRALEVDQAFALSQIDPRALVSLRATGECTFTIHEVFFDLFYPGCFKRRIKAARLTIPCITGPYVNVSATLRLERSWLRPVATPLGAPLVEVPPSRSVAIATSTAQNDAGVFELSFRDERYMPFEGLGAISQWRLTLPKSFRQLDYQTINDVVLSMSYTAEQDGALRDHVEAENKALEGGILHHFSNHPAQRLFSMRQEHSGAFTRLLRSPAGSQVQIEISDRNLPMFFRGRDLQVKGGAVLLRTASGVTTAGLQLSVDGAALGSFSPDPGLGDLAAHALPEAFTAHFRGTHTLAIQAAGELGPASPPPGDLSAIDGEKLLDLLLYVEYQVA